MSKSLLSLLPPGLAVDHVTVAHDRVVVAVRARAAAAACPVCRRPSRRVHSRYSRRLGDLPWQGRIGQLDLQVRRFRCAAVECPRRIFAERLPAVALPKVRRTVRLSEAQRRIALSAGGEAGARLAACLAMPVSGDTLLRLIRAAPLPAVPTPRVIGIDDWSWRRGQRYGTIIVDLERNRPIDLLPDRHAGTVAAWLKAHPGVEVVARDRAGAYADGIRAGAPNAVQVSDRWHLLRNLGDALAGVLDRHHHDLRMASKAAAGAAMEISTAAAPSPTTAPLPAPAAELPTADRHGVRKARFDEVMALHGQGWPMKRIARTLGVNRKTVRAWVRAGELPVWSQRDRGSAVDLHAVYLRQRWGEGCHNAARLWQEIQERGFRGQLRTVQRWVHRLRDASPTSIGAVGLMGPWKMPSKRRAAWLVVADPETIDATEQRFVDALLASSEGLTTVIELARAFSTMVRRQQAGRLDGWLAAARETALAGFADGLVRDLAAIRTALSLPWSTGPVEGQISRLKTIKRTMCGRAKFDLLRHRVLEAA
ncbi:transposase [Azospirillum rugosum]|uniref:Transposase n=1 Tax=Azospirillum rugosum TaxID=416170 RepID=A0ABS4SRR4_9PROT|nr:transposase [Azospirillum rugosum]MDQ0528635.1 transposase [Azospirillum rugosum]